MTIILIECVSDQNEAKQHASTQVTGASQTQTHHNTQASSWTSILRHLLSRLSWKKNETQVKTASTTNRVQHEAGR
jgi:hypothetical protein